MEKSRSEEQTKRPIIMFTHAEEKKSEEMVAFGPDIMKENTTYEKTKETLFSLSDRADELSKLDNNEMLALATECLENFVTRKEEWGNAGKWAETEMELVGKSGSQKGALALRLRLAFMVGCGLRTHVEALKCKINPQRRKPTLLRKVRDFGDSKVYGPASAGILGGTYEVWTRPDLIIDEPRDQEGVAVILGAGNNSIIGAYDVLHKIFTCRQTVLYKHHPLRPWLMSPYEVMFEPLTKRGYFSQILDPGIPQITKILSNSIVKHVHMTGSYNSANVIRETLALSRPTKLPKEIDSMMTCELGAVSPWIVAPGKYTRKELVNAATSIVASKKNFGGANCVAGQVVIIPEEWDQGSTLIKAIISELRRQPDSMAFYPGASKRLRHILSFYDKSRITAVSSDVKNPDGWKLTSDDYVSIVDCGTVGKEDFVDAALQIESFGPVLAIVKLPRGDTSEKDYLSDVASPFVNNKSNIFGCLSCNIITPPSTVGTEPIFKAIRSLRYGMIAVNEWIALGTMSAPLGGMWGANPLDKTGQSGNGFVGNQYNIPHAEKMVVYGNLVRPKFDETTQPPPVVINKVGIEIACRRGILSCFANFTRIILVQIATASYEKIGNNFFRILFISGLVSFIWVQ